TTPGCRSKPPPETAHLRGRTPASGVGGAFAERRSIFAGETAEFIEAEAHRNLGDIFRLGPGRQQRVPGLGQSHRMTMAGCRDAVDGLEGPLGGALADVDCRTNIGNAIELTEARACDLLEPIDDVLIALPHRNGG